MAKTLEIVKNMDPKELKENGYELVVRNGKIIGLVVNGFRVL